MKTSENIGKITKDEYLKKYYKNGCMKYLVIENKTLTFEQWTEYRKTLIDNLDCSFESRIELLNNLDKLNIYYSNNMFRMSMNIDNHIIFGRLFEFTNPLLIYIDKNILNTYHYLKGRAREDKILSKN